MGDTLTLALQAGEIDAAYGLPYISYPLFENEDYVFTSTATSRVFFGIMNMQSARMQDPVIRQAIAMGIDKERFTTQLLSGNGVSATGPFPEYMRFGKDAVQAEAYDPEKAKELLTQAGWIDQDGDGIREKGRRKADNSLADLSESSGTSHSGAVSSSYLARNRHKSRNKTVPLIISVWFRIHLHGMSISARW